MATNVISEAEAGEGRANDANLTFNWLIIAASLWFAAGLYFDGWAHNHGKVDDSFFTPWHASFYSGFAVLLIVMAGQSARNLRKKGIWTEAAPAGYGYALVGSVIFALGGVGDLVWHTLFGIEENVEALLSPTHLLLAVGMSLATSGPFRAAWHRREGQSGWLALAPAVLSATIVFSVITFMTQFVHPLSRPWSVIHTGGSNQLTQALGVTAILLQAGLLVGISLLLIQRWQLPFGSMSLLYTLNATAMSVLDDQYRLISAALIAGLLADLLIRSWQPTLSSLGKLRGFGLLVSLAYYSAYFLILFLTDTVRWSIHLWSGSIVLAAVAGLLLAFLLTAKVDQAR